MAKKKEEILENFWFFIHVIKFMHMPHNETGEILPLKS